MHLNFESLIIGFIDFENYVFYLFIMQSILDPKIRGRATTMVIYLKNVIKLYLDVSIHKLKE